MRISQISKPVTAKSLNESLAKKFGQKIKLEDFTLEQLQDVRNKLRTKVFNVETHESYDAVQSETYQKSKLFLDVLNAAINEREVVGEAAKPDFLDVDKDGDKKEPMKKAAKDAKGNKPKKGVNPFANEGTAIIDTYFASILKEGAEDHAELVMAAKDMVDRVTGWMEDTAEMQTESMLELADAIRDEMGSEKSEAFTMSVKPALEAMYGVMETTRIALTGGVSMLTGEGEAPMMGAPDDMGMEPPMEPPVDGAADLGMDPALDDEFGAAAPAAGGAEEAGRAKRESRVIDKKKVVETSRKISTILSKKK
tara:strand:+ start:1223 stop:2152 length:930 start_codon:yes stop_codon:yes gene_type:complete